jgi:hypothetical protein
VIDNFGFLNDGLALSRSFQGCQMFIFKPKIQIWVNFGGPWIGKY